MEDKGILAGLCKMLKTKGQTLAVAESVTSGMIQSLLSSVEGATDFYQGGITTYNLDQKVYLLGVDRGHASACNCVSVIVAGQMAENVCRMFGSDYGLGITGYASPVPEKGIRELVAYCSIAQNGKRLYSGMLTTDAPTAVRAQKDYAVKLLNVFYGILEKQAFEKTK